MGNIDGKRGQLSAAVLRRHKERWKSARFIAMIFVPSVFVDVGDAIVSGTLMLCRRFHRHICLLPCVKRTTDSSQLTHELAILYCSSCVCVRVCVTTAPLFRRVLLNILCGLSPMG